MIGRLILQRLTPTRRKWCGKASVLAVTYLAYAVATAARLPYAIAKTSLRPDQPSPSTPGWAPFTDSSGQVLLGSLDTAFMAAYAAAMPFMGRFADRTNQPAFLALSLLSIGVFLVLVGMAHAWNIHVYAYFVALTFLGGCAQSMAYPCVIAVISKWCGKSNIGLILGIWGSCTPMGTILGKLGATAALAGGWQYAFISMGVASMVTSVIIALFLVSDPYEVQLLRPGEARRLAEARRQNMVSMQSPIATSLLDVQEAASARAAESANEEPVPLAMILRVPGMVTYCIACFFAKLAYYAFVFWLPFYLDHALHYDRTKAGYFSTFFDWGGFTGGIVGGLLIDRLKLRGVVLLAFQALAAPMLFLYMELGQSDSLSDPLNAVILFLLGFTVTTPYSLITSVMSTDLGRHPYLNGNSKAAATVTALLDGIGSFGAVLQGLVIGWISDRFGWSATFLMLMAFAIFSALCLAGPSAKEFRARAAARVGSAAQATSPMVLPDPAPCERPACCCQ